MPETRGPAQRWVLPAVAGVASVALGLGVGQLVAAVVAPASSPFVVVGSLLIDLAPAWAKDAAIALFGTGDKAALLVGIGLVLLAVAGAAGVLEARRPPWGMVVIGAVGVVGAVAAASRANASMLAIVPSAVAAIAAMLALTFLLKRLAHTPTPTLEPVPEPESDASPIASSVDRRRFLGWAGGAVALGALAALGGYALQAGARAVTAVRDAITLPKAVSTASVPAGAELGIDGLAPVVTPNAEFYRIDTALAVPAIDPAAWSLRIHGLVDREVTLTWDELLALPLEESITTLACVSNEVGGGLIGNAVWLGYPIRELLARAGASADADMVLSRSIDGFTASTPLEVLQDDRNAILAVGMNGEPLPTEHGFPVRMVVPGLYGYVSATKWVVDLEVTRFDAASAYWTDRGWSERGPIKISSRIDVPRQGQSVSPGSAVLAGVAWHQHVGIAGVEVQIDDGDWRAAELATAINDDTWVQWRYEWPDAAAGSHTVRVRALGADGEVQTASRQGVVPDGATGLDEVTVEVR
ncbi:DMSO/TMAO reductase YedYZ molybdopterin-dependent catalytic subunit [Agromyces hippuratus]|uniref:DMSO/TMAO reductase YedYZ molybdopterin-dependent catalytic subunit n=1 Tax=Agromyces hippuratus TaxID=286438 RepID=A0A852WU66_9MICO|nr:molybdopterin-dependent oxidoreductase [Agromyces hippuratus]NYG21227.1 DMSO/TMAO reductase YedYZ molybdopterin-dependent catalytic subunit [Agromyces hippuratus]